MSCGVNMSISDNCTEGSCSIEVTSIAGAPPTQMQRWIMKNCIDCNKMATRATNDSSSRGPWDYLSAHENIVSSANAPPLMLIPALSAANINSSSIEDPHADSSLLRTA